MTEVPQPVLEAAQRGLKGARHHVRETFDARLQRWWPDLRDGLALVYPDDVEALAARFVRIAAKANARRSSQLQRLDLERTLQPDWFQSPSMVGYAAYTDRFAGGERASVA
jgi:amylosucrase